MKYGVKVTEEKVLGALGKRQGLTDVEVAAKLKLSTWKKVEVRAILNKLADRGTVVSHIRSQKGTNGRPPLEFRKV